MQAFLSNVFHGSIDQITFPFVFVFALILILNNKKIFDFLDELKKIRIKNIKESLNCESVLGEIETKSFLEEELVNEYFRIATGIRLEKALREQVIKIYNYANGDINFKDFKRAKYYLRLKNGGFIVKLTIFDTVMYGVNTFLAFLITVIGAVFLAYPLEKSIKFSDILLVKFLGLICVFVVFMMFVVNKTYTSARKIKNYLIKHPKACE